MKNTTALIVLDGFGISNKTKGNAIKLAKMKNYNSLLKKYPHSQLKASGSAVGLKNGQMGNSEVGHLTIGSGRIILQDLTRIDKSIADGSFFENKEITQLLTFVKNKNSVLHILGLVSNGGVHSHINHLFAILKMAKALDLKKVYIHCFTDGRDTEVNSGIKFLTKLENFTKKINLGKIATISGRYYAMDREKHYDRIKLSYDAIVNGKGKKFENIKQAFEYYYSNNITDEFILPSVIESKEKYLVPSVNDGFIFFNFRKDRTKELTESLVLPNFEGFKTNIQFKNFVSMTCYGNYKIKFAFHEQNVQDTLSEYLSKNGLKQLKLAEPTKFAHVTYFFNGEKEEPFKNEDRIIVPAKNVATFDLAPEMSCEKIAEEFCNAIKSDKYDFILVNIANGDMVGHTGNLEAGIKAMKVVDSALKKMSEAVLNVNGNLLITADHGNIEEMLKNEKASTTHSLNPVPFVLVSNKFKNIKLKNGKLSDIAPTILKILSLKVPTDFTGKILF